METNQLRSFMEVVKTGNFSEAAENLYTTQSSVSNSGIRKRPWCKTF